MTSYERQIFETSNYRISLYHSRSTELVVVFTSAGAHGLGEPVEEFRKTIEGFGKSMLFFMDLRSNFYNHADTLQALKIAGDIASRYRRVGAMGESMGACGALIFSQFVDLERILAFSPQYSVAKPYINFDAALSPFGNAYQNFPSFAAPEARSKSFLLFGNREWKDHVHAGMYILDQFNVKFIDKADHMVARRLKAQNLLKPLLLSFFNFDDGFNDQQICRLIGNAITTRGIDERFSFADYASQFQRVNLAPSVTLNEPAGLVNLARGAVTDQSSISEWSIGKTTREDSARAVAGIGTSSYAFHTDFENCPWWTVDLGQDSIIYEIRVYNRIDPPILARRAQNIVIECSGNAIDWILIMRNNDEQPFGGSDGNPLLWRSDRGIVSRHIRLRLLEPNVLHLAAVEVFGKR